MPAGTDVRAWLIEQGHEVPKRGPVPAALRELYDTEHGIEPGDDAGEVSGADPLGLAGAAPRATAPGERAPARARRSPLMAGARERLWGPRGRPKAGGGRTRGKHARVSLADFAEETWSDLAALFAPMPPVQKILTLQAPYAGVVAEGTVKGTVVDSALQPLARNLAAVKAVNGLLGPPVYVAAISLFGGRVEIPVAGPDGEPVRHPETGEILTRSDFDPRTRLMFLGLKHSLMQMAAISPDQLAAVQERAADRASRSAEVDMIIQWLFSLDPPPPGVSPEDDAAERLGGLLGGAAGDAAAAAASSPPSAAAAGWPGGTGWPADPATYPYPPPGMDGTGADPGRASLPPRGFTWSLSVTPPAWRGGCWRPRCCCCSRSAGGAPGSPGMPRVIVTARRPRPRRWRRKLSGSWRAAVFAAGAVRGAARGAVR